MRASKFLGWLASHIQFVANIQNLEPTTHIVSIRPFYLKIPMHNVQSVETRAVWLRRAILCLIT